MLLIWNMDMQSDSASSSKSQSRSTLCDFMHQKQSALHDNLAQVPSINICCFLLWL